jgi:rhodanese-related sulfurtransferase
MNYPISNDAAFLAHVLSGRVEPFGHREHLRLAFLCARAVDTLDDVIAGCRTGIRSIAAARGAHDKYDEAVTSAWAARMLEIVRSMPGASFDEVLERHPGLASSRAQAAL